MPTPSTSDLPKPEDWDEFEDIVLDIFKQKWNDPKAKRYGGPGQKQHGVDIYGQPKELSGAYVGVQCKRYSVGKLNKRIVNEEIKKAENFSQPLAEFIIATTDNRDVGIQDEVMRINEQHSKGGVFTVEVLFWEDLVHELTKPENVGLVEKYYLSSWYDVVREHSSQQLTTDIFGQVIVLINRHIHEMTYAEQNSLIQKISETVNVRPNQIRILRVDEGSVNVNIVMPEKAAQKLFTMYLENPSNLEPLGILNVELPSIPVQDEFIEDVKPSSTRFGTKSIFEPEALDQINQLLLQYIGYIEHKFKHKRVWDIKPEYIRKLKIDINEIREEGFLAGDIQPEDTLSQTLETLEMHCMAALIRVSLDHEGHYHYLKLIKERILPLLMSVRNELLYRFVLESQ